MLLFLSALGSAQVAPGDEDDRCYSQVVSTYPANKPILMSSNHYLTLLGSDGVWDQIDLDDHDTDSTFNPTFVSNHAHNILSTFLILISIFQIITFLFPL